MYKLKDRNLAAIKVFSINYLYKEVVLKIVPVIWSLVLTEQLHEVNTLVISLPHKRSNVFLFVTLCFRSCTVVAEQLISCSFAESQTYSFFLLSLLFSFFLKICVDFYIAAFDFRNHVDREKFNNTLSKI